MLPGYPVFKLKRVVKLILTGSPRTHVTVCRSSLAVIGLPEQAILLRHHGGMIMNLNLNIECIMIYCSESLLSQVFRLTLRRSARPL
jgi:hypothetical protein